MFASRTFDVAPTRRVLTQHVLLDAEHVGDRLELLAERVAAIRQESPLASYTFQEDVSSFAAPFLYYRVKARRMNYEVNYSRIVKMVNERTAG